MTVTLGHTGPESPSLKVLQVTDTHLFGDVTQEIGGLNTEDSCRQVFEMIAAQALPADLILITGDLVHDRSLEAYARLQQRVEEMGVPALAIPGNHDDVRIMAEALQGDTHLLRWEGHRVVGNWVMVMLDSTCHGKPGGHFGDAELQRLESVLASHPDKHALVCLHHHPLAMGSDWIDEIGVDNGAALFAVLERFDTVRAVIWGHVHQEFHGEYIGPLGRFELLACPSTCLQFAPGESDFTVDAQAPGYRILELAADGGINTQIQRLSSVTEELDLRLGGY